MIGPHTIAGGPKDLALQDVKAKTDQHIELLGPDSFQSFGRKTVDKLAGDGFNLNSVDA